MAKKGLFVWLFSSLTFISVAHLVEAIYVFITGSGIRLLQIYPFVSDKLMNITPTVYLWISAISSIVFWGISCAIAFENPMEDFLNRMLSDAKKQSAVEAQVVENKCEILDAMYETIESSSAAIASIKDLMNNVRTEVKEIQPLSGAVDLIRLELNELTSDVEKLEGRMDHSYVCLACGKPLLPEFKICPYCGENAHLLRTPVLAVSKQK